MSQDRDRDHEPQRSVASRRSSTRAPDTTGTLVKCAVATTCAKPVELATGLKDPFGLAVGASSIVYTTRGDGKVWRLAK